MLKSFIHDRSGNFSSILALSAVTLLSAAGMAVDLSNQMRMKTELQNTVDAATLSGAALAYEGKPEAEVKKAIKAAFSSQCPVSDCNSDLLLITIDAAKIEVESKGSSPTFLMGLVGISKLDVNAKARVNLGGALEHIEVHMVLDNTGSMNIVDGVAAINQFKPLFKPYEKFGSPEQCAFACHINIDGAGKDVLYDGKTGAEIARANGIPMREDRIHREMIDQAKRLLQGGSNIKVGVYSFTWGVKKMIDPSDNFGRVKNAINDVTNLSEGTQYEHMAPETDGLVGVSGSGLSPASPKKVVVLITDGVQQRLPDHKAGLMPLEMCNKLKEGDREVYVLNIVYPDPDIIGGDQRPGGSPAQVKAFYNDIEPRLKECASSTDLYFRAEYGATIDNALKKIADKIMVGGGSENFYLAL